MLNQEVKNVVMISLCNELHLHIRFRNFTLLALNTPLPNNNNKNLILKIRNVSFTQARESECES